MEVKTVTNQKILLSVKDLTVTLRTRYGNIYPVQKISCSIKEGEIIGIVGESGSGKSVFALSLGRLLPEEITQIEAEELRFLNYDLLNVSERDWRKIRGHFISYVFQDSLVSLNPHLTIGYQIVEPLYIHFNYREDMARQEAVKILKSVQIPDPELRLSMFPHELSGGMRQRVAIAMALITKPKLLIADEPTTALDATLQIQVLNLFRKLHRDNPFTMIIITHDLSLVAGLCSHVWIMYAGKILEQSTITQIFRNPAHPYTFALLSLKRNMGSRRRLESLPGTPPDLKSFSKCCPFVERCPNAVSECLERDDELTEIAPQHFTSCWRVIEGEINLRL